MASKRSRSKPPWSVRLSVRLGGWGRLPAESRWVAGMFGLGDETGQTLYDDFEVTVRPGQIVAVIGPSGAGKSVLLREVRRQVGGAIVLDAASLVRSGRSALALLGGASRSRSVRNRAATLAGRLAILARTGLAEARALVMPARALSGGQMHRLAIAEALYRARLSGKPRLVIADEFAAVLDPATAKALCRQVRRLVDGDNSPIGLLVATPRTELLPALRPDRLIVKPLGRPARLIESPSFASDTGPAAWPIEAGTIRDYDELGGFHYLAGRPAAHKRVYVLRAPQAERWRCGPDIAAVLVVSPPLMNCRGRNAALLGRYTRCSRRRGLRRLNAELEAVSRVIVHPIYRGCGLAIRMVRHALATAQTPLVEALAVMGRLHPFFEKAGMYSYGCFDGKKRYVYYLGHRAAYDLGERTRAGANAPPARHPPVR